MMRAGMLALALMVLLAGCGQRKERSASELRFERLADTVGLAEGEPLLETIEPYREANGAIRVRGRVSFPDGVRIQLSIIREDTRQMVGRVQVVTRNRGFDSPPVMGAAGPLSAGTYRIEVFTLFNPAWQTEDVLRRTDEGRSLRGPGMTRDRVGGAAFFLAGEHTL